MNKQQIKMDLKLKLIPADTEFSVVNVTNSLLCKNLMKIFRQKNLSKNNIQNKLSKRKLT
jgi:hypothetical protein